MADWTDQWLQDAQERFNKIHAPAGSAAGGQFAAAAGSGSKTGKAAKDTRPTPSNAHPVGKGETGKRVSDLQSRLNALGAKLAVDGIFGPKTLAAVKAFQKAHGLKVDGLVGPKTTAALRSGKHPATHHTPAKHTAKHGTSPAGDVRVSELPYGPGSKLWKYWTAGEGFAKWSAAVHKWTTLRDLLLKAGVPAAEVDGLTTNIIQAVMPGYMKLAHKKGRSAMTHTDDADRADTAKPYGDVPYADPGYLDADGNQASKSGKPGVKRYPLSSDKVMAAWGYINQADNAGRYTPEQLAAVKGKIKAAMAKHGHMVADTDGDTNAAHFTPDLDVVRSGGGMELHPEDGTLGRLTGRFSEFGRWYKVSSKLEGDFMERVARGATLDTIRDNRDAMRVLFDHGMDAQICNKVLGPIDVLEEKSDGPHYEVPLFDTSYNRDLLPGLKAEVYGASMRMRVTGDKWDDKPPASDANPDGLPERTITGMKVLEFGPVTFPANPGASAAVRSGTDEFYHRLRQVNAPAFEDAMRAAGLPPEDFTGRDGARSAPGGEMQDDVQPGNGGTSPPDNKAALMRDRAWRMRRQPYA